MQNIFGKFFIIIFNSYLFLTILTVLISNRHLTTVAQGSDKYKSQLIVAEKKYLSGNFDDAIAILTQILSEKDIIQEEKQKSYRLLGLTYLAKELEEEALIAVKKLLEVIPDYQTDPEQDPPEFIEMVEANRQIIKKKEAKEIKEEDGTNWLIIAGGAVAGVVAAVLILGSGGDDGTPPDTPTTVPEPPGRPPGI